MADVAKAKATPAPMTNTTTSNNTTTTSSSSRFGTDQLVFDVNFTEEIKDDKAVVGILHKLRRVAGKRRAAAAAAKKTTSVKTVANVVYSPTQEDDAPLECVQMELPGSSNTNADTNATSAQLNQSFALEQRLPAILEQKIEQLQKNHATSNAVNTSTDTNTTTHSTDEEEEEEEEEKIAGDQFDTLQVQMQDINASATIFVKSQSQTTQQQGDEIEMSLLEDDSDDEENDATGTTTTCNNNSNNSNNKKNKSLFRRMVNVSYIMGRNSRSSTDSNKQTNSKQSKNADKALAWLGSPIDNEEDEEQEMEQGKNATKARTSPTHPYYSFHCACIPEQVNAAADINVISPSASIAEDDNVASPTSTTLTEQERIRLEKMKWHKAYLKQSIQKYLKEQEEQKQTTVAVVEEEKKDDDWNSIRQTDGEEEEEEEEEEAILNPYDTSGEKLYVVIDEEEVRPESGNNTTTIMDESEIIMEESFEQILGDSKIHVLANDEDAETTSKKSSTGSTKLKPTTEVVKEESVLVKGENKNVHIGAVEEPNNMDISSKEDNAVEKPQPASSGISPGTSQQHKEELDRSSSTSKDKSSTVEESLEQVLDLGSTSFVTAEAVQQVDEDLIKEETIQEEDKKAPLESIQEEKQEDVSGETGNDPFHFDADFNKLFDATDSQFAAERSSDDRSMGSIFKDLEEEASLPPGFQPVEEIKPPPPPPPLPPYPSKRQHSGVVSSSRSDAAIPFGLESVHDSTVVMQNGRSNDHIFVIDPKNFSIQNDEDDDEDSSFPKPKSCDRMERIEGKAQQIEDTKFLSFDDESPEVKTEKHVYKKPEDKVHVDIEHIFADAEDEVPFDEYSALADELDFYQADENYEPHYTSIKEVIEKAERKISELEDHEEDGRSSSYYEDDSRTYESTSTRGFRYRRNHLPQGIISECIGLDITQELVRSLDKYIDGFDMQEQESDEDEDSY